MMDLAKGNTAQATNFLRVLRLTPAGALSLQLYLFLYH
jgi:hypothetical protein